MGGGRVDVWNDISASAWCLGGCMNGRVGRLVVVGWLCGWTRRYVGGV